MNNDLLKRKEKFQKEVEEIRRKLDKVKYTGLLEENLEEEIAKIKIEEEYILNELIPYYRLYSNKHKTSINIKDIQELGIFRFESYLNCYKKINNNIFLISGINKELRFIYLNDNQFKSEWTEKIKLINESIQKIYRINLNSYLLFGIKSGIYLLKIGEFSNSIENINKNIKIEKIKSFNYLRGYRRILRISNKNFLIEDNNEKINLYILDDNQEYIFKPLENNSFKIDSWEYFKLIESNYFVITDKFGNLYFIKYKNKNFITIKKINVDFEIRNIEIVYRENKVKDLLILGNNGNLIILNLENFKENLKLNNLNGNLFKASSQNGIVVILTEDGIIYTLEENFSSWKLNNNCTKVDAFYTNIIPVDNFTYLILNIDNKFDLLKINRINNTKDLLSIPLY